MRNADRTENLNFKQLLLFLFCISLVYNNNFNGLSMRINVIKIGISHVYYLLNTVRCARAPLSNTQ